jgi:uncharacterized membrane protein YeaQ/YmgE (transglycosylase-associated protein family)
VTVSIARRTLAAANGGTTPEGAQMYLILALIVIGLAAGAVAERVVYPDWKIDWTEAFVVGLVGSFVGGLLVSLIAGDGLEFRASGIIGSIVGAIILLAILKFARGRIRAYDR